MAVLQDYQLDVDFQDALVYYKGPFDEEVLVKISSYLREGISNSRKTTKKVFSIFIELAQNISKYSSEHNHFMDFNDKHGVGVMAIYKQNDRYVIKAGNLMEVAKAIELEERCSEINQLDYDGLKRMRKELNATPMAENATGGRIGLLQIALKSEYPIRVNFASNPHNDYAFVVISTEVTG
ncbi:MAG: SiaB family protein kinase [Flammeovirgaceae bacterium]